jgi:Icc-related predicted phosphoesterase
MSRTFGLLLSCLLVLLSTEPAQATQPSALDFAVIGDPQIGYGVGSAMADKRRFVQLIQRLNEAGVPLVVIPGDLVQDRNWFEHWAFATALGQLRAKALLAPGNHDVVDVSSLADYRRRHGPDYYVETTPSAKFVIANSETAGAADISALEFEQQWAFLERALPEAGAADGLPTFVVTHRPPFVDEEEEPHGGGNWPPATRARLLSLCRRAKVETILAGHLHREHRTQTRDGIEIRVLCGSARCFDESPIAYTRFQGDEVRTVHVAAPPPVPVHVPYLREWTPRLFDFSPRHWVFTALFGACGWMAWRAARKDARRRRSPFSWVALLLFFFAVNMQLDFDEGLREVGRIGARLTGVAHIRHALSPIVVALTGLVVVWRGVRRFRQGITGRETAALVACLVPCAWFALSTMSHHDLRMVLDELVWDVLVLLSLSVVAWASVTQLRQRLRR